MRDIAVVRARLDTAEDLPALLTAGRDAFGLIRAICRTSQDRSDELSPTFTAAAASAVHGRSLLTAAASTPPAHRVTALWARPETASLESGLDEITGALAGLASVLASRLRHAGSRATQAGDHMACRKAAATAETICDLLTFRQPAMTRIRRGPRSARARQPGDQARVSLPSTAGSVGASQGRNGASPQAGSSRSAKSAIAGQQHAPQAAPTQPMPTRRER